MHNITRHIIIIIALLASGLSSRSQITLTTGNGLIEQPANIKTTIIKKKSVLLAGDVYSLTASEKTVSLDYFDGFGRPLQNIFVAGSPNGNDLIKFFKYDDVGREARQYLPYVSSYSNGTYRDRATAITEQASFYTTNNTANKIVSETKPYADVTFEASPLGRLHKQGDFGDGFQPTEHYKQVTFRASTSTDAVKKWSTAGVSTSSYSAGELIAAEGLDENSVKTIVFTDKIGRMVLKRQEATETIGGTSYAYFDTYYIHDNLGNIAYVIPPKAYVKLLSSASLNITYAPELIYSYKYDSRNRLTERKVPTAAVVYYVYDPLDRLVLIQDGNMRSSNKWLYRKYDNKNRIIIEGVYTDNTNTSLTSMQSHVDGQTCYGSSSNTYYEERTSSGIYYTNSCFPTSNTEERSYNYYDNYDLDLNGTADYSYQSQGFTTEPVQTLLTNGVPTITKRKIVGTSNWLIKVLFYDKRYSAIQVQSNNQVNTALEDHTTAVINFAGEVTETKEYKKAASGVDITVKKRYVYDNTGRLKEAYQKNNSDAEVRIGQYNYNPLGQLVEKNLHYNGSSSYLQSVDFRYNIRGQLTSINNSNLSNDVGVTNDETNDVFGMELLYDQQDAALSNTQMYNGLLSAVKWKAAPPSGGNTDKRAYLFTYDKLSRLTSATYKAWSTGSSNWSKDANGFNETVTYDWNGNILSMARNAVISGTVTSNIDELTYDYGSSNDNNKLLNITEGGSGSYGFINHTSSSSGYTYDNSGNLTADAKKGITITYNESGKPTRIEKNSTNYVEYRYDAVGIRISKWVTVSGTTTKQEYVDGYVFDATSSTPVLSYFPMNEGRVRKNSSTFVYEYFITDHLGNVRVSFEDNGSGSAVVKQENSYYPFGMIMAGSYMPTDPNKNLYNAGSEWQNDLGVLDNYSTFFREYDPVLGRFNSVDPLAEASCDLSVYQFANNNPANFNDPMGDYANPSKPSKPSRDRSAGEASAATAGSEADAQDGTDGPTSPGGPSYNWNYYFWPASYDDGGGGVPYGSGRFNDPDRSYGGSSGNYQKPEFKNLYKKDLIQYYKETYGMTPTDQQLGAVFEDLFNTFVSSQPELLPYEIAINKDKAFGEDRNTIPDFKGNAFLRAQYGIRPYTEKIRGASWYELKAKFGGLYLSSNLYQMRGHIDNIAREFALLMELKKYYKFMPELTLVTTADVRFSLGIWSHAIFKNVSYNHLHAEYRKINGRWEFQFVKPASIAIELMPPPPLKFNP